MRPNSNGSGLYSGRLEKEREFCSSVADDRARVLLQRGYRVYLDNVLVVRIFMLFVCIAKLSCYQRIHLVLAQRRIFKQQNRRLFSFKTLPSKISNFDHILFDLDVTNWRDVKWNTSALSTLRCFGGEDFAKCDGSNDAKKELQERDPISALFLISTPLIFNFW